MRGTTKVCPSPNLAQSRLGGHFVPFQYKKTKKRSIPSLPSLRSIAALHPGARSIARCIARSIVRRDGAIR